MKKTKLRFQSIEELTSQKTGMKRDLGLFRAIGLIGGLMIGSGIFYIGSYVLNFSHGNSGIALLAWAIAGLISLGAGLCYAEMASFMPQSGGTYLYITQAFGPCLGFAFGWTDFWISTSGSVAALGLAAAQYIGSLKGGFDSMSTSVLAALIIIALSLVNMKSVKTGGSLSTALLAIKVAAIVTVLAACFSFSGGKGDPIAFVNTAGEGNFMSALVFSVVAALWAYDGWSSVCTVAEEVKEPQRNIARAMLISVGGITVIYLLYNIALMKVLPVDVIISSENPTFDVIQTIFGTGAATAITLAIICSILGSANSCLLAYPREFYAMARDYRWFPLFGKLSKSGKTPIYSQLFFMIYTAAICFSTDFVTLVNVTVLAGWLNYTTAVAACIVLRRKYPDLERPYKVAGYPVIPIAVILCTVVMLAVNFIWDPITVVGLLIPLSGVPAYFLFQKYFEKRGYPEFKEEGEQ